MVLSTRGLLVTTQGGVSLDTDRLQSQLAEMVARHAFDPPKQIKEVDVIQWAGSITNHDFYNMISLEIALRYQRGILDFSSSDGIVNDLWSVLSIALAKGYADIPSSFFEVYLAFDAGEFYRTEDCSDNPEKDHTRPAIEIILAKAWPLNI
jgi:hypothetical protein